MAAAARVRERVPVLGEHVAVAAGQPAEQLVRDLRSLVPVLAIAAVRRGEGERGVGRDLVAECAPGPTRCRTAPAAATGRSFRALLVCVERPGCSRRRRSESRRGRARRAAAAPSGRCPGRSCSSGQVMYSGSPSSTRPTSTNITAVEAELAEDPVGASPRVRPRVVERQEQRPRRELRPARPARIAGMSAR